MNGLRWADRTRTARAVLAGATTCVALWAISAARADTRPEARTDPPAQVGRLSWLAGDVRLRNGPGGPEQAATRNWPLTSGDALSTGAHARAEVWIGSTALRLDQASRVAITRIDEDQVLLRLQQGTLALRVATPDAARNTTVETPAGRFAPQRPGEYRVDTTGSAAMDAEPDKLSPAAAAPRDDFANFVRERDSAYAGRTSTRYVSPEMTGVEDLDGHGRWAQSAEYGALWLPDVPPGWAPYRQGRWASIAPWGWTWVDDEPWGFAPFHYGRWLLWQERWAWVPGRYVARPVYAPALVGWIGAAGPGADGGAGSTGTGTGSASATPSASAEAGAGRGPGAAWFPLGPRDTYLPACATSAAYLHHLNPGNGVRPGATAGSDPVTPPAHYLYEANPAAISRAVMARGALLPRPHRD